MLYTTKWIKFTSNNKILLMNKFLLLLSSVLISLSSINAQIRSTINDPWDSVITDGFGNRSLNKGIYSLKRFKDKLYAGAGSGGSYNGKVYFSGTGNKLDWTVAYPTNMDRITVMSNYKDSALFISGSSTTLSRKIYRTIDGYTFKSIANNLDADVTHILPFKGVSATADSIYIIKKGDFSTGYEIWVSAIDHSDSINYLSSWRKALDYGDVSVPPYVNADITAATVLNNTLYIAVNGTNGPDIIKTTDGINFSYIASANIATDFLTGFGIYTSITSLSTDGTDLFAGTIAPSSPSELWKSTDGGYTWNRVFMFTGHPGGITSINYFFHELWASAASIGTGGGLFINRGDGTDTSYVGGLSNNTNGDWGRFEKFNNHVYYGCENIDPFFGGGQLYRLDVCNFSVTNAGATSYNFCLSDSTDFFVSVSGGKPPYTYQWIVDDGSFKDTIIETITGASISKKYAPINSGTFTISLSVTDSVGCMDNETQFTFTASSNQDIIVTVDSTGVVAGIDVDLYKDTSTVAGIISLKKMSTVTTNANGIATFTGMGQGDYWVHVNPDPINFPTLLPTYFDSSGSQFQWDSVIVEGKIVHNCSATSNITLNMIKLTPFTSGGIGKLRGRIVEGFGYRLPGDPIPGAMIKVGRKPPGANNIAVSGTTDAQGWYEFNNVPLNIPGEQYIIYADIPGYGLDPLTYIVTLDSNNTQFLQLNYYVDSTTIWADTTYHSYTNISEQNTSNTISVYPNPTTGNANVFFSIKNNTNVSITLYNALGVRLRESVNKYFIAGSYHQEINFDEKLSSGVYFIIVNINGQNHVSRIILNK